MISFKELQDRRTALIKRRNKLNKQISLITKQIKESSFNPYMPKRLKTIIRLEYLHKLSEWFSIELSNMPKEIYFTEEGFKRRELLNAELDFKKLIKDYLI